MEQIRANIRNFFSDLTFEEKGHQYCVGSIPIEKSVSTLIKDYCTPFEEERISKRKAEREGLDQQGLLDTWHNKRDKAISTGKQAHLFGELYPFNRGLRPQSYFDVAIMKFWDEIPSHVIPILVELPMYHKEELYAGTPDGILLNIYTGKLIIIDYKTNEDLFKNFKSQTLLGKFSGYLDTPYNKYQIQLSYYKILLEQAGYEVSTCKIIWLKNTGEYAAYDTEDLTQYLK